jgi:pseudaminic acid biosynthesis-associated methylase
MGTPLEQWQGQFGVEYTDRNPVQWETRVEGFAAMLDGRAPASVLEVGCNRGHNLKALAALFPEARLCGVEPGGYARLIAEREGLDVEEGDVCDIPWGASQFELVFCCGVLIHVPPDDLDEALSELTRVSSRLVLLIEYADTDDVEVEYRGRPGMLWRRDYGSHAFRVSSELSLIASGTAPEGFEDATFWLFEKSSSDRSG